MTSPPSPTQQGKRRIGDQHFFLTIFLTNYFDQNSFFQIFFPQNSPPPIFLTKNILNNIFFGHKFCLGKLFWPKYLLSQICWNVQIKKLSLSPRTELGTAQPQLVQHYDHCMITQPGALNWPYKISRHFWVARVGRMPFLLLANITHRWVWVGGSQTIHLLL